MRDAKVAVGDKYVRHVRGDYSVIRECVGHAYARNGNAHNPTPRFTWRPTFCGTQIGTAYSYRGACDIIDTHETDARRAAIAASNGGAVSAPSASAPSPKLTAAQRRACEYLANHQGYPATRLVAADAQVLRRMCRTNHPAVCPALIGGLESFWLTDAGRAALERRS